MSLRGYRIPSAFCLLVPFVLCAVLASFASGAMPYVWFEGESPTSANFEFNTGGWGNSHYLSGENWLHFSIGKDQVEETVPDGIMIQYDFQVDQPGDYEIWGRVGFEFVRSTFQWRINEGEWTEVESRDPRFLTTDLMEIARWCEIAWLNLGDQHLTRGHHTLEIQFPLQYDDPENRQQPRRLIGTLDAFCLSQGRFVPHGPHKPDADWQTRQDREAAQRVVALNAQNGPRVMLNGLWQIARYDESGLVEGRIEPTPYPDDIESLHWSSIEVPGDRNALRPELAYCHRYLYRTRVKVPEAAADQTFLLKFCRTSMIVSVYVNGQEVGYHDIPRTGFTADCSQAIRPGEMNEIVVGVKDAYYALSGQDDQNARYGFNFPLDDMNRNQGITMRFDYPMKGALENGILDDVMLETAGPVYIDDVYLIPNVDEMRLDLEVTLKNATAAARNVELKNVVHELSSDYEEGYGGSSLISPPTFPARRLKLAPRETQVVNLSASFQNAKLWWPDAPTMYQLRTDVVLQKDLPGNAKHRASGSLAENGYRCSDQQATAFGFRQWGIEGRRFTLNGVPWQFRANLDHYNSPGDSIQDAQAAVAHWRETGQNMFRHRFQKEWGGMNEREMLSFFDRAGVPVRRNVGTFDGQHASYRLALNKQVDGQRVKVPNEQLFENWRRQAAARVRQDRNHPCIFVWELDNEIIYINARNFGNLDVAEPEFKKTAEAVQKLDRQGRGVMVAGGRALMDQSLPVNGCHYEESPLRDYPDMAYGVDSVGDAEAWTAALPENDTAQAVVHSLRWTNPRPDRPIQTVQLRYNDKVGNRYGAPVLLGITASQEIE